MARILIVDDEETIRFTFESFLSDQGHAVAVAAGCEQALARLADAAFDLVVSDIILGGRSGIEVLNFARERQPTCPVVMITGQPTLKTAGEAIRLGAFDYIAKPVRLGTLLEVVERALKHKGLTEQQEGKVSRIESIFRNAEEAIIAVDSNGIVTEVNEAAGRICGLAGLAVGKPFAAFQRCCGANCLELLEQAMGEGKSLSAEHVELSRAGLPNRIVTIVAAPLRDEQGRIAGAVLTVKDETPSVPVPRECRKFHGIVGNGTQMQQVYELIETLANTPTTVLITGETGTGKELVAAALHYAGKRSAGPFVKVNCSALSEDLLESELFGHVIGAFTGASRNKIGRFERANRGTILLDEIGDISPRIQSRLLRVLQEKEFERVGDSTPIRIDVRILAATNKLLLEKVKRGEFREDLYYRLKVVEIHLPPLRERREDIPSLTEHFLEKFRTTFGKEISTVSAQVREIFLEYPWPGNVRELEHVLEHAFILCPYDLIQADHLPQELRNFPKEETRVQTKRGVDDRDVADRGTILEALAKTAGNKASTARLLGMSRQTLYRRLKEYGIT